LIVFITIRGHFCPFCPCGDRDNGYNQTVLAENIFTFLLLCLPNISGQSAAAALPGAPVAIAVRQIPLNMRILSRE